jgi:hypothetical protein
MPRTPIQLLVSAEINNFPTSHQADQATVANMGMRKLSATEAQDLCELLEERSISKSTLFTTQLPLDHWSEVIGDPVIAVAIRDRLQHSALAIHIIGESYRGVKARKLANRKKDS